MEINNSGGKTKHHHNSTRGKGGDVFLAQPGTHQDTFLSKTKEGKTKTSSPASRLENSDAAGTIYIFIRVFL